MHSSGADPKAALTSPASGSTFSSGSVTLQLESGNQCQRDMARASAARRMPATSTRLASTGSSAHADHAHGRTACVCGTLVADQRSLGGEQLRLHGGNAGKSAGRPDHQPGQRRHFEFQHAGIELERRNRGQRVLAGCGQFAECRRSLFRKRRHGPFADAAGAAGRAAHLCGALDARPTARGNPLPIFTTPRSRTVVLHA